MGKRVSLEELHQYILNKTSQIRTVSEEMKEIQVGFNSKHVAWKADHDAALERLVEAVLARMEEVGPELKGRIEERVAEERRIVDERRQELRDTLIPQVQAEVDDLIKKGRTVVEFVREENPRLDEREEQLKAKWAKLEGELTVLNERIRKLSGCLGVVFNFLKINKLDRQRQRVIGQMYEVRSQLRDVRQEWQETRHVADDEEDRLQVRWQELTREVAQMQGELDYLEEASNRENLALRRAVRHVIDNLKEPIPCPAADVKADLDGMVTLNIQTDDTQGGLGVASGLIALLDGIIEGMKRFDQSVAGLVTEQHMHSAYLKRLDVDVPDDVEAFHAQWEGLAQKVRDDGRLCENPAEFLNVVLPEFEGKVSEAAIRGAFESLGRALSAATSQWG
ncbi:MAG: hypothetical protein JW918_14395 [Anaerolineae bacterium]|nr:hypothetical protein [Anaerolineae bacterium]